MADRNDDPRNFFRVDIEEGDLPMLRFILGWALVILGAAAFGVMVAMGASCGGAALTAADATTALKLAVCVEQAVQEESANRQARVQQLLASPDVQAVGVPSDRLRGFNPEEPYDFDPDPEAA